MITGETGLPISIGALREELSEFNTFFGFEEKIETGSLDTTNKWTEATANTGAVSIAGAGGIKMETGATAASTVSLQTKRNFAGSVNHLGTASSKMFKRWFMEFGAYLTDVANINNTTFIMGFCATAASIKADDNMVAGFILTGDTLFARSNVTAGTEDTDISAGITLTDVHLFKIEHDGTQIKFYVDGVLKATHTTHVPSIFFPIFYIGNGAGTVSGKVTINNLRAWYEQ